MQQPNIENQKNNKPKFYIASGFFNPHQLADVEMIKRMLNAVGANYFSPKDENLAEVGDSTDKLKNVFDVNVREVEKADFVIVNTRDKDIGTIFEAGVAYKTGKKIIYYFESQHPFNLMLSYSGIAVCRTSDQLYRVLQNVITNPNWKQKYEEVVE